MRLPLAIATLAFAVTTAVPAFAATPSAPILASLQTAVSSPVEGVASRQTTRQQRQTRSNRAYRSGYNAYAASPRARRSYGNSWGHCVSGLDRSSRSAFPNWDLC